MLPLKKIKPSFVFSHYIPIYCMLIFLAKIIFYFILRDQQELVGGGNDADYYHFYAEGYDDIAPNFWPIMLRFLSGLGLYDRDAVSYLMFLLGNIAIPVIFSSIVVFLVHDKRNSRLIFWSSLLLIIIYPTIFYYSLDIYRDVFMYTLFLAACASLAKHKALSGRVFISRYLLIFFVLSYACYLLRGYLGAAMILALFVSPIVNINKWFWRLVILYVAALMLGFYVGIFDQIIDYRGVDFSAGGTTIGISFVGCSVFEFPVLFVYSTAIQLLGFYFTSLKGIVAFLSESLLFILCLTYVIKNRYLITPFMKYLLCFFVIYNSIWLIGNDNLGTAVRLRVFGYISIYLVAATIFFMKSKLRRVETPLVLHT